MNIPLVYPDEQCSPLMEDKAISSGKVNFFEGEPECWIPEEQSAAMPEYFSTSCYTSLFLCLARLSGTL